MGDRPAGFSRNKIFRQKSNYNKSDYIFSKCDSAKFVHESSVDKFLDAMTTQLKFPFSTEELR